MERGQSVQKYKSSEQYRDTLWRKYPAIDNWPQILDIYEAAAFLRVSPDTIRRALTCGRDGKARLAHSRPAGIYRIRTSDLLAFGRVEGR
jgi:hypothetical protein